MALTQYLPPAFLQCHSFSRETCTTLHHLVILRALNAVKQLYFSDLSLSLTLRHPVSFLLKPSTLLLLTRPCLIDLILISQTTLKRTCATFYTTATHLPDSGPSLPDILPTLTFLSRLNPVFLHQISHYLPTQEHLSPDSFHLSFLHLQFSLSRRSVPSLCMTMPFFLSKNKSSFLSICISLRKTHQTN